MTATDTTATTTTIPDFGDDESDRKICFICSKGTLDMAYPALVMANGALRRRGGDPPLLHLLGHGHDHQEDPWTI